ncbi:S8 family serine peptidase [Geodermatophilus sp. YIM 151500]|uniref:S8 family serine peptidase n=1 Tax=Geodermatophilus sp. YIM 151500 TaxID=2984531 RepID=UPI0021E36480|nr:S8 family serine peptidase [Geodermatophilus sp. YIM 151500]MCV2490217.1 S8 family serine peptidase [Geodermatophilus sp. YIM 151500]
MRGKRAQAVLLTAAAVAGYAGAAAWAALAGPAVPVITDLGEGDGLTRYVVTAAGSDLPAALETVDGVVSAQALSDGRVLVATDDLSAGDLASVPGVAGVEPSVSLPLLGAVTDPYFAGYGWHLDNTGSNAYGQPAVADADVDAPEAWDAATGAGTVVAVIDSGFDSDHPDLAGSLWTNPDEPCGSVDTDGNGKAGDCHGWNFYAHSPDVDNGGMGLHGAAVSGVVGARAGNGHGLAGLAPDTTIMPLVVGGGRTMDVFLGAEAIRYAVDHGADVINASWGGAVTGTALGALRSAVAYAAAHDVLVVAAAGNDSANRDTQVSYPASLTDANVVTVGASTAADTVSSFSAYGATSVDLFAPGTQVFVTTDTGGYGLLDGTSFSAPLVAAAVALHRSALPAAGAQEIKQALLADVDPVPAFAGRSVTGGRLSVAALAGASASQVRYAFSSMTAPAGEVSPVIGASGPDGEGAYSVALGLGMETAGEIWALSGKDVTLDGVTVATDDAGDAVFPLGSRSGVEGLRLSPTVQLGDGRYVLTVQLHRDGEPVGRTYAAPLLVGAAAEPPSAPGGTSPDTSPGTSPGTPPGTGTGTVPGTPPGGGTTAPDPGTSPLPTPPGGTGGPRDLDTSPGTGGDDSGHGEDADGPVGPGAGGGSGPVGAPGTGGDAGTGDGTGPGGEDGGEPPSGPDTPDGTGGTTPPPGTGGSPVTPGTPADGGTRTYPEVGEWRVTSLSPTRVSTAGGTLVTVTGRALPAEPTVLVGSSATAEVVSASTTKLVFRAPARVAGAYDVAIWSADRRATVLSRALTYAEDAPAPGDGPGGAGPGTDGGDPADGTDPGPGGTGPGTGGTDPGTDDGTDPDDGSEPDTGQEPGDGSAPGTDAGPVVRSGPAGERLVRSSRFAALGGIWSLDCSASCTGVAI